MIKTAVVILNWNGAGMLRTFLPSVVSSVAGEQAEVYVADNASSDDSCELIAREFPSVRLIRLEKNWGFADGYNKALEQIDATYAVLLNSDIEVTPRWLSPLVKCLDSHPEIAACQPKILSYRNRDTFEYAGASGGFIDRYGYPFCRGRIFDVCETDEGQYDTVISVFWATGAALCIRMEDYRRVGGLDGRFFAHMEEIDLCWRLRSRGRKIVCLPQSVVYHVGGATLKKENPRKTYLNFRNNLLMLYKNLPDGELAKVLRVRGFLDRMAMAVFFLKGNWRDAKAVMQARRDFARIKDEFAGQRRKNLCSAVVRDIPQRFRFCLLWQYHVLKKRHFSDFF